MKASRLLKASSVLWMIWGVFHFAIGVAMIYFGLLRCCNVLKVQVGDVRVLEDDTIEVKFEHERKRIISGYTYNIPNCCGPIFRRYLSQLPANVPSDSRFL